MTRFPDPSLTDVPVEPRMMKVAGKWALEMLMMMLIFVLIFGA